MNDIKLALLGSPGAGKSAVLVRFLTRRFIGEYASNTNSLYHKRLSIDGRQLNLEVFDPCSQAPMNSGIDSILLMTPEAGYSIIHD
ncbi:hypothetical protein LDENG_00015730 [Lucifuga dentata]|nr:hypothetical protein LDENG_00015730 [Lucifuga dentata]